MNMNSIIISIDGNIGSGKSTLYNNLKNHYKDRDDICFVPEPVDSWHDIQDSDGTPILTNLYKDTKRYAFRFQMMAYISRLHIYNKWFDEFLHEIKIEGIIYVKADPKTCLDRVNTRGREGENIPIEYLQKCHEYHENWLSTISNILTIDANSNVDDDSETRKIWINRIDKWINKDQYVMRFDGACRGNPSNKLGLGFVIYQKNTEILHECKKAVDVESGTNNIAEYMALIEGLKYIVEEKIDYVDIYGDSDLIIKQVIGVYKVKALHLKVYHDMVKELIAKIPKAVFQHVPRNDNAHADKLANEALDDE